MPPQQFDPSEMFKSPDAFLDFSINWSRWLSSGEEIVDSSWVVVTPGISISNPSHDGTKATVWVSGGTAGSSYTITNTITTSNTPARVDERSILVTVVNR